MRRENVDQRLFLRGYSGETVIVLDRLAGMPNRSQVLQRPMPARKRNNGSALRVGSTGDYLSI